MLSIGMRVCALLFFIGMTEMAKAADKNKPTFCISWPMI